MKQVTWAQVVLILGVVALLLATVIVLAIKDKDISATLTAAALVLATLASVFGVDAKNKMEAKLDQVKEVANGRLTDALTMVKELQDQVKHLALAVPPPPPLEPVNRNLDEPR
jgi:uncharacterized iron-regulated protein